MSVREVHPADQAAAAICLSSLTVITNANRLKRWKPEGVTQ